MKTRPVLGAEDVEPILTAARDAARARGLAMTIAIVDDGGYALRLERMDGAGVKTPDAALGKARTAAWIRGSTAALAARVASDPALLALPDYLPMAGGLPLIAEGVCVGAIGISGGRADDDEAVAAAGVAALRA